MQSFIEIFNGELGSSVRGKLNRCLGSIISGNEGINAIWNTLRNLHAEMQALDGGVGGLITSTAYDPSDLDPYKSVTLIALGKGTFTNLKDSNNRPITISQDNSFTIFYRGAGENYWRYTTTVIAATIDTKTLAGLSDVTDLPITGLAKDGQLLNVATNTDAVYDKAREGSLTDSLHKLFSVIRGFAQYTELDSLYMKTGFYVVINGAPAYADTLCMGLLEVFSESQKHMVYQRLTINCVDPNVSYLTHVDADSPQTWERRYNLNSPSTTTPARGTWSSWVTTVRKVTTEDIVAGAITGPKIAENSITTSKIADGTIQSNDINENAFDDTLRTHRKLADAKVVGDELIEQGNELTALKDALNSLKPAVLQALSQSTDNQVMIGNAGQRIEEVNRNITERVNKVQAESDIVNLELNNLKEVHKATNEDSLTVTDEDGNIILEVGNDGLDTDKLTDHFKGLIKEIDGIGGDETKDLKIQVSKFSNKLAYLVETNEEGLFIVDDNGNINAMFTKEGFINNNKPLDYEVLDSISD